VAQSKKLALRLQEQGPYHCSQRNCDVQAEQPGALDDFLVAVGCYCGKPEDLAVDKVKLILQCHYCWTGFLPFSVAGPWHVRLCHREQHASAPALHRHGYALLQHVSTMVPNRSAPSNAAPGVKVRCASPEWMDQAASRKHLSNRGNRRAIQAEHLNSVGSPCRCPAGHSCGLMLVTE